MALRLALYEPDIPQNAGAILRLAACLGVAVDIIGPCGFVFADRHLRRVGMDYLRHARMTQHPSWQAFRAARTGGDTEAGRLVLLSTRGGISHLAFAFQPGDVLLLGRESAGVPDGVHAAVDAAVRVPMAPGMRSLNVAAAAAIVLGEALRQTGGFAENLA
jgi:tRNA (cytidine/uridine-2'-O-)-methyltransferase